MSEENLKQSEQVAGTNGRSGILPLPRDVGLSYEEISPVTLSADIGVTARKTFHENSENGASRNAGTPKISVIVPVYKVEKYLPECIESVLAQTFTDFELLLVDDGSPDSSGKICDGYAARDSRIRVFHKPNGGVSSARNLGLKYAIGDWVIFVDADDKIEKSMLGEVLPPRDDINIVFCGQRIFKGIKGRVLWTSYPLSKIEESSTANKYPLLSKYFGTTNSPCGKLFSRSFLIRKGISFPETIALGEDTIFLAKCFQHNPQISILSGYCPYFVRRGVESAVSKYYENALFIYERIQDELSKIPNMTSQEKASVLRNRFWFLPNQILHPKSPLRFSEKMNILRNALGRLPEIDDTPIKIREILLRIKSPILIFLYTICFRALRTLKRQTLNFYYGSMSSFKRRLQHNKADIS